MSAAAAPGGLAQPHGAHRPGDDHGHASPGRVGDAAGPSAEVCPQGAPTVAATLARRAY